VLISHAAAWSCVNSASQAPLADSSAVSGSTRQDRFPLLHETKPHAATLWQAWTKAIIVDLSSGMSVLYPGVIVCTALVV
jgi:hypothetical protein